MCAFWLFYSYYAGLVMQELAGQSEFIRPSDGSVLSIPNYIGSLKTLEYCL
jgi:hypothetical protein